MLDFASFETFDPAGAGLGNLFDRLSPLQALGIWPSGDFRVEPGDGTVPAVVFYLGAALAAAALVYGLRRAVARGERVLPAALGAAALLWLYALVAGTPYQEAKALVLVAPLARLISVRALLERAPTVAEARRILGRGRSPTRSRPRRVAKLRLAGGSRRWLPARRGRLERARARQRAGRAAGLLARLAELRDGAPAGLDSLVVAPRELLADQHGVDWLAWELRGNRICVGRGRRPAASAGDRASRSRSALDDDGAVVPVRRPSAPRAGAAPARAPDPGRRPRRSQRGRLTGSA